MSTAVLSPPVLNGVANHRDSERGFEIVNGEPREVEPRGLYENLLASELRRMYIYESLERMRAIGVNDQLEGGDLLPGFSFRLGDLFAVLDDPNDAPQIEATR